MNACPVSILFPRRKIRLDVNSFQSVPRYNIKLTDGIIIFRRITGSNYYPAVRHSVSAENLVLQELEHNRSKRFGHAVYLIEEQYALFYTRVFHKVIHCRDDFRHSVLRHVIFLTAVILVYNERQSQCGLPCVVRHGVRQQTYSHFRRYLLHYCSLAYSGRSHQKYRALFFNRNRIAASFVLCEICRHGILYLFFCFFNIHILLL